MFFSKKTLFNIAKVAILVFLIFNFITTPVEAARPRPLHDKKPTLVANKARVLQNQGPIPVSSPNPCTYIPTPVPVKQMAMRKFYSEIKGLKVKEVPEHVKPMLSTNYLKNAFQRWLDNYHAKYIQTNSVEPLLHVCYGGMIFSYLVALPEERRHLKHQEHGGH